jgi:hypothetical protein
VDDLNDLPLTPALVAFTLCSRFDNSLTMETTMTSDSMTPDLTTPQTNSSDSMSSEGAPAEMMSSETISELAKKKLSNINSVFFGLGLYIAAMITALELL